MKNIKFTALPSVCDVTLDKCYICRTVAAVRCGVNLVSPSLFSVRRAAPSLLPCASLSSSPCLPAIVPRQPAVLPAPVREVAVLPRLPAVVPRQPTALPASPSRRPAVLPRQPANLLAPVPEPAVLPHLPAVLPLQHHCPPRRPFPADDTSGGAALEPFFNAAATQFILGQQVPFPLWLSLAPIVIGVSMASLTELSFNWTGFINAMISNISFTYRSIYSKKAMTDMDSTNVYAYITIISLIVYIPLALIVEGLQLMQYGYKDAIAKKKSA